MSRSWWQSLRIWLVRLTLLLVAGAGLMGAGAVFQTAAAAADRQTYPPPGRLIDIGGYRLHLHCMGKSLAGRPTVVFESALGAASLAWSKTQPLVAARTRACAYDRAGYGWSEPSPYPRDAHQIAIELHTLLERAGESPPFVLVGHSLGGILIRVYAQLYPDQIAGLVLVDARHEDFFMRMPAEYLTVDDANYQRSVFLAQVTPFGLTRMLGATGFLDAYFAQILDPLPAAVRPAAWATMINNPSHWAAARAERDAIEWSYDEARQAGSLGDVRLIVLSAENGVDTWRPPSGEIGDEARRAWAAMQDDLAALSTNSQHIVVPGSGHMLQLDYPAVVADAIDSLITP